MPPFYSQFEGDWSNGRDFPHTDTARDRCKIRPDLLSRAPNNAPYKPTTARASGNIIQRIRYLLCCSPRDAPSQSVDNVHPVGHEWISRDAKARDPVTAYKRREASHLEMDSLSHREYNFRPVSE